MMRSAIVLSLLGMVLPGRGNAQEPARQPRFIASDNADAWQRMPQQQPQLPVWARILVEPLPKATAALVELDHSHRAANPLGPVLAGKLRWVAADAIGCEYARRYAEADLRRAGLADAELQALAGDWQTFPPAERAALALARQMTLAAHEVSDEQVAELIAQFGAEKVVGIVHTVAFASFQNRLLLALQAQVEPDGPLAPVDLQPDPKRQAGVSVPPRPPWDELPELETGAQRPAGVDWGQRDFAVLEQALQRQKDRTARIPLPPPERLASLPEAERERTAKIVWSSVSVGYQPELTGGWFRLMQVFRSEAQLDRVFSNSVFWVVTRSNECFY